MGVNNIAKITDQDLKENGITKREFELIQRFLDIDPEIFAAKEFVESSPFTYGVDLAKYDSSKMKQDLKNVLYRPKKMRLLYEKYWQLASAEDKASKDK